MRTYRLAMKTTGLAAGLAVTAFLVLVLIALGDGPEGIEVPRSVNAIAVGLITILTVLSSGAWFIDRSNRAATEAYIRPTIRTELEQLLPELVQEISDNVTSQLAEQLNGLQERDARRVAQSVSQLTIARTREVVADEVEERMQHVLAAGRRQGAVLEAQNHRLSSGFVTDHGISNPPKTAAASAKVHQLPRQPGADER